MCLDDGPCHRQPQSLPLNCAHTIIPLTPARFCQHHACGAWPLGQMRLRAGTAIETVLAALAVGTRLVLGTDDVGCKAPWWPRGDRRSHCQARKIRVLCTCLAAEVNVDHPRAAGRARGPRSPQRVRRIGRVRPRSRIDRTSAPLLPRGSHARILVVQADPSARPQIRMFVRRVTHVGLLRLAG